MKMNQLHCVLLATSIFGGSAAVAQAQPGGVTMTASRLGYDWMNVGYHKRHRHALLPYQLYPGDHYSVSSRTPRGAYEYSRDPDPWMRGMLLMDYNRGTDIPGAGGGATR